MDPISQYIGGHLDVLVYLVLVIIEQFSLLAPGTWPYRYGFPVRFKPLNLSFEEAKDRLAGLPVGLHYGVDAVKEEICLRNAFPLWTWCPLFFTAQAQFGGRGRIIIRMAPLSSLGVIYVLLAAVGTFQSRGFVTALILALLFTWYYRWLVGKFKFLL